LFSRRGYSHHVNMNPIDTDRALYRYKKARNEVGMQAPDGWLRSMPKTKPLDPRFDEAEIKMCSHIDQNPNTDDRIDIWNSRRENSGELIYQEVYVQSHERMGWTFKKTPVLHVFHHALHAPGNVFLGAAFATIDLTTGKPIRSLVNDEAAR